MFFYDTLRSPTMEMVVKLFLLWGFTLSIDFLSEMFYSRWPLGFGDDDLVLFYVAVDSFLP